VSERSQNPVLGWGVIGTGQISHTVAADMTEEAGCRRVAVASRDQGRADEFAVEHGFARGYASTNDLLDDPAVEVVYIATPHGTHREIALDAVRHGKHILIEKPAALNRREVDEIREAAIAAGVFAMEGMWMKFSPAFQSLLSDIRGGAIGEVRSVSAGFGFPFPAGGSRWSAKLGGSTLLDQGIYPISLATALLGTPAVISARGQITEDGVDLAEHLTLEFDGGGYAQLAASMIDFVDTSAVINGTAGWITVPRPFFAGSTYTVHAGASAEELFAGRHVEVTVEGNGYVPMIRHVNQTIAQGERESDVHPWSDCAGVFDVMDTARQQLIAHADIRRPADAATPFTY
jgi:predicted dehydrogenase